MRKLALTLLMATMTTGVMCTSAFAETVTFNGGHIYQAEQGKPGTIKLDLTNIDSQANVKMDDSELMTYLDDDGTVDKIIYTDEVGKGYSIRSLVAEMNAKGGVPVYTASSMPSITAKTPLTAFMSFWKGDDTTKVVFAPKFYLRNDYMVNDTRAKVYATKPDSNWLYALGTAENVTKAGKYLFVVHDNGGIDCSPLSVLCVNVGETANTTSTTATPTIATATPPTTATAKVAGWSNNNGAWYYLNAYGARITGWLNINEAWYYLNTDGTMKTGWLKDNGTWYYLNDNGAMAINTAIDGYTLDANGALIN